MKNKLPWITKLIEPKEQMKFDIGDTILAGIFRTIHELKVLKFSPSGKYVNLIESGFDKPFWDRVDAMRILEVMPYKKTTIVGKKKVKK